LGLIEGLWVAGIGIGAALIPPLIAVVGIRRALAVTGLVLPAVAVVIWRWLRDIDDEAVVADEAVALLQRIPIFSPLPPAAMERVAASLEPLRVNPGIEVIRQGDAGDRFYVVTGGKVDVEADGEPVGTFGPGYFFGEIALLRDVPRTATVRAVTRVELQALDRDDFLGAVTGHVPSARAAEDVVTTRLAGLARPALRRV
jgi:Cyclic nucleotide-binding domain